MNEFNPGSRGGGGGRHPGGRTCGELLPLLPFIAVWLLLATFIPALRRGEK